MLYGNKNDCVNVAKKLYAFINNKNVVALIFTLIQYFYFNKVLKDHLEFKTKPPSERFSKYLIDINYPVKLSS